MKILLAGVETNNKGAELMLYAILQEIERVHPDAHVYLPKYQIKQGLGYIKTKVKLEYWPFYELSKRLHLFKIFKILHIPFMFLPHIICARNAAYYFDASGFAYSDQFKITDMNIWIMENQLSVLHKRGCRIVFLPQAFGPAEKNKTKEMFRVLNKYANVIMPRETVSMRYINESGLIEKDKIKVYTDFTSHVDGVVLDAFQHISNGICVIPNIQMIKKGGITREAYLRLIKAFILLGKETGHPVYLLNHEGVEDEQLCYLLKSELNGEIDVITGYNALEVKGLISTAYLVISSRFHGVVSALNSCIPCLATSWSHKYQELFKDYQLEGCVLSLDDVVDASRVVNKFLNEKNNKLVRMNLVKQKLNILENTNEMWRCVWNNYY